MQRAGYLMESGEVGPEASSTYVFNRAVKGLSFAESAANSTYFQ